MTNQGTLDIEDPSETNVRWTGSDGVGQLDPAKSSHFQKCL